MKKSKLKTLIAEITRRLMAEYDLSSTGNSNVGTTSNTTGQGSADILSPGEAAKQRREALANQRKNIRTAELDLKGTKKQSDYFNQQVKKNKLDISAKEKDIQNLKAGKQIAGGGAGSITSS